MDSRDLVERAMRFAVSTVRFCGTLANTWEGRRVGAQLLNSATSVAINYRSARRGRSRAEFIAKLGIVVEECDETVGWLELIQAVPIQAGANLEPLLAESRELLAIFAKAQKTARENHQR